MTTHYFTPDGEYGDADGLAIIDTSRFTRRDWDDISATRKDERLAAARMISSLRQASATKADKLDLAI